MATGRGSLEGGNGEVEMGRGATGTEKKWQWGVGQRGGASNGGRGGDGKGAMGRGKGERGVMGRGRRRRKKEEGGFTDRYDGMLGWT